MTGRGPPLVNYASSDDEAAETEPDSPPRKKRKLPPPPQGLVVTTPTDNPALHQGRVRSSPHIDGRWVCHVYVPAISEAGGVLGKILSSAYHTAKLQVPTLHPIGLDNGRWELHVSLSRPTFLWTHQREEFKHAVRRVATSHQGWTLSLAEFIKLENDDHSRVFLAVQVGAGHEQLTALTDALKPALRAIRQNEFYPEPKFHVSIAWALLAGNGGTKSAADFPTITDVPRGVIEDLNREFAPRLRTPSARLEAEEVCVKIGKDAFRWGLGA